MTSRDPPRPPAISAGRRCCRVFQLYLAVLAVPMFFAGSFLGVLVIFGQGSKAEGSSLLTAVLLLLVRRPQPPTADHQPQ